MNEWRRSEPEATNILSRRDNPELKRTIYPNMKTLLYGLLALVLATPFAKPANAQVVVAIGGHHHRHCWYSHHHRHCRYR